MDPELVFDEFQIQQAINSYNYDHPENQVEIDHALKDRYEAELRSLGLENPIIPFYSFANGLLKKKKAQRRSSSELSQSRSESQRAKQQRSMSPLAPTVPMDAEEPEPGEELTSPAAAAAATAVPAPAPAPAMSFWDTPLQEFTTKGKTYEVRKYNIQSCCGQSTLTNGTIDWPDASQDLLLEFLRKYAQHTIQEHAQKQANGLVRFWPRREECFDNSDVCRRLEDISVNKPDNQGQYCTDTTFTDTDWVPVSMGFLLAKAGFKKSDRVPNLVTFTQQGNALNTQPRTRNAQSYKDLGYSEAAATEKLAFISVVETGGATMPAEAFSFFELHKQSIEIHAVWGHHGAGAALLQFLTDHTVGPLASTKTKYVSLHSVDTIYAPHAAPRAEVCNPEVENPRVFSLNKYYRSIGF